MERRQHKTGLTRKRGAWGGARGFRRLAGCERRPFVMSHAAACLAPLVKLDDAVFLAFQKGCAAVVLAAFCRSPPRYAHQTLPVLIVFPYHSMKSVAKSRAIFNRNSRQHGTNLAPISRHSRHSRHSCAILAPFLREDAPRTRARGVGSVPW